MVAKPTSSRSAVVHGFTLIELMIAVAIVAIIAAVAFPSFQDSIRKGRRAESMAAVAAVQQSQERWRANNPNYSTSLTELRVTEPALYTLSLSAPTTDVTTLGRGYVVTSTARGSQAADTQCAKMSVRLFEGNLSYGACANCTTFTYATSNPCFSR